jgi:mRNA interferase HigB
MILQRQPPQGCTYVFFDIYYLVHVISFAKLRVFFEKHPQAEISLRTWLADMKANTYGDLNALWVKYPQADWVKPYIIFNIGGNDFRLVVVIHFNRERVYIREVFTHAEYSKWSRRKL